MGFLPLTDSAWRLMVELWWKLHVNSHSIAAKKLMGGFGALYDTNAGQRSNERSCVDGRMEFDGGGEALASS